MIIPIKVLFCLACVLSLFGCTTHLTAQLEPKRPQILVCEQATASVLLMDADQDWALPEAVIWSWHPLKDPTLTDEQRGWFSNLTDAKPIRAGQKIVVCASGGGAAIVDKQTSRAVAVIYVGANPHSVEVLPDGRIIIASSHGDKLSLWDVNRGEIIQAVDLIDAHGVAWDTKRRCLWALGGKQLKRYHYDKGAGRLLEQSVIDLPVTQASKQYPRHGGHDLTKVPGQDAYFVSDMDHLWRFDRYTKSFAPLPQRHAMKLVKSISQSGEDGPILVLQATDRWHASGPRLIDDSKVWNMPGARIYKARWWMP